MERLWIGERLYWNTEGSGDIYADRSQRYRHRVCVFHGRSGLWANLARMFYEIPFEPYAPGNAPDPVEGESERNRVGFQAAPSEAPSICRRVVQPFEVPDVLITVTGEGRSVDTGGISRGLAREFSPAGGPVLPWMKD